MQGDVDGDGAADFEVPLQNFTLRSAREPENARPGGLGTRDSDVLHDAKFAASRLQLDKSPFPSEGMVDDGIEIVITRTPPRGQL